MSSDVVALIAQIPGSLISDTTRARLVELALRGAPPWLDIYTQSPMTPDYTDGGGVSYVIEYALAGRLDNRWSPVEFSIWCDAGCMPAQCDCCGDAPTTFVLDDGEHWMQSGRRPHLCFDCHCRITGQYGRAQQRVAECPRCREPGLFLPGMVPCIACQNGRRLLG